MYSNVLECTRVYSSTLGTLKWSTACSTHTRMIEYAHGTFIIFAVFSAIGHLSAPNVPSITELIKYMLV